MISAEEDDNNLELDSLSLETDDFLDDDTEENEEEFTIEFHEEDRSLPILLDPIILRSWLNKIAVSYGSKIERLDYILCSDEYLIKINQEYLNHDDYTDIITFPYKEGRIIESDIFVSLDRVKENAEALSIEFETELLRVFAHGLLHLIGFKDKTQEDVVKMRKAEDDGIEGYGIEVKI